MSQIIVLKNGNQSTSLTCPDGSVEITENGHVVLEYAALMEAIRKWGKEQYGIDEYV
jgi:hypothetical protein